MKADISDEAQVETTAKSALDAYGRVDILVNNAAVLVPRGILDLPTRHIDLHNRVNIKGPILCIRAVLPTMLPAPGMGHQCVITRRSFPWSWTV